MESVQNDGLLTSGAPQHHDQHPLSCSPQENTLIRGVTQGQRDCRVTLLLGFYFRYSMDIAINEAQLNFDYISLKNGLRQNPQDYPC